MGNLHEPRGASHPILGESAYLFLHSAGAKRLAKAEFYAFTAWRTDATIIPDGVRLFPWRPDETSVLLRLLRDRVDLSATGQGKTHVAVIVFPLTSVLPARNQNEDELVLPSRL